MNLLNYNKFFFICFWFRNIIYKFIIYKFLLGIKSIKITKKSLWLICHRRASFVIVFNTRDKLEKKSVKSAIEILDVEIKCYEW